MSNSVTKKSSRRQQQRLVFCICIAEFDILKGNTLSHTYPKDIDLNVIYKDKNLADMCLPDGAHIYEEDSTYLFLPDPSSSSSQTSGSDVAMGSGERGKPVSSGKKEETLYGMVLFRNKKDVNVKRGAVQKSIVLFSMKPFFSVWEPLMRATIMRVMDEKEKPDRSLKILYNCLNDDKLHKELSVTLFNEKIPIKVPKLEEDQYAGVSLVRLVERFKTHTMFIWYGLMMGKRIFFTGTPAKEVANCCLACPLLVHPLHGFTQLISPYVALTDMAAVFQLTYINGSTNTLFQTKPEWWDFCGSFQSGTVLHQSGIKLSGKDKEHILNVMGGIQDGKSESWVREQFSKYTKKFIDAVIAEQVPSFQKKLSKAFKSTPYFANYLHHKETATETEEASALDILNDLQDEDMPILDRVKKIFSLSKMMEDLSTVEKVCEHGGVEIVSWWLTDDNSQFRKYAASVIASLASSIKGQLAILQADILQDKIIKLLDDEMPNVRTTAAYCIMKISTLYVGVQALLQEDVLDQICANAQSSISDIKMYSVETLYNIYRFVPNTRWPDVGIFVNELKKTADVKYKNIILKLLDLWGEDLTGLVKPSSEAKAMVSKLRSDDIETKIEVSRAISTKFAASQMFIFDMINLDIVDILRENNAHKNQELSMLSIHLLTSVADTQYGRRRIQYSDLVHNCIRTLRAGRMSISTLHIIRFCEVLCQHEKTTKHFLEEGGLQALVILIMKYYHVPLMAHMASRAVRCLYNLIRIACNVPDMLDDRDFETLKILSDLPRMDLETTYANTEVNDIPVHQQETLERFFADKARLFSSRIEGIVKRQLHYSLQCCLELIGRKLQVPEELQTILANRDIQLPRHSLRLPVTHEFRPDSQDSNSADGMDDDGDVVPSDEKKSAVEPNDAEHNDDDDSDDTVKILNELKTEIEMDYGASDGEIPL